MTTSNSTLRDKPREVVETLRIEWDVHEDPDSPRKCICGHLHYLRRTLQLNQLSWRFCEDPKCHCQHLVKDLRAES